MAEIVLDDLIVALREAAGQDEQVDLNGDVLDSTFGELGYDSLALLQTTGIVEREHGIKLADEAVVEADTPRKYLELVNRALVEVARA
ncbi:acyl carrier protein [Catellatospora tritici]|uniref:acyl carrier protein n=1 Tax=Catellatospora tritici TaxID=2851566 RepID=UPI001C2D3D3C|nr:acyl carrier protein [Catellatospora tritici]MBV1855602.1 acyl carrier protein [Catellatospora tritici]